jgi:hypothetical protein
MLPPEPQPVLPLARIRPALSPADVVLALLQSLIDKFKGLREGLEVQQRALAGKAVKADARTTVAVPEGVQCANPAGKGTTSANAVVIKDKEGTVIQPWLEKSKKRKKNRVMHGVARGRKTGIFYCWNEVLRSVQGFSGAMHKRFRSEEVARAWLAEKRASGFGDNASGSGHTWATMREDSEIPQVVGGRSAPNDPPVP